MSITPQQLQVVQSTARLLAVDAFAGTGKTTTLVRYAEARPDSRILYLAFNKSVAAEAATKFPKNVDCKTTHGLAYAKFGVKYKHKLGSLRVFDVTGPLRCDAHKGRLALYTLNAWLCSTDDEIGVQHAEETDARPGEVQAVVKLARQLWEQMCDPQNPLKMVHDGYLKLFAMSKPQLRYDTILLDEAQDTNPITLQIVMSQVPRVALVLVGDKHQSIYGFRKADNAMESVDAEQRIALTQSFRFGQEIADAASALLRTYKREKLPIQGRADLKVKWEVNRDKPYTVIARTNAALFDAVAAALNRRRPCKLHFVGGLDSYPMSKVLDAHHLWSDKRKLVKDEAMKRFSTFDELKTFAKDSADAEFNMLVKVVEQHKHRVPVIYNEMIASTIATPRGAHVTLTTAHKAKGLEWEQVELCGDFIELPVEDLEHLDPEDINVLYVALTRATRAVHLPRVLANWFIAQRPAEPHQPGLFDAVASGAKSFMRAIRAG